MSRVCLVTTGHLSTNPRLVKEADALVEAGYTVSVLACSYWLWAEAADASFASRPWDVRTTRFGGLASGLSGRWIRLRHRLAREAAARLGPGRVPAALLAPALHYITPDLTRLARDTPADLYIAHNLGALPAAAAAAQQHGARLGFDAEDFHRGELADVPANAPQRALVAAVEDHFLPRCDYVTAASEGIGRAYAEATGIALPTTILNVFPRADRTAPVEAAELAAEVPPGARSLHWFSQTIGPGRGLEDAVRALRLLPEDVVLSLRGGWADGYEARLRGLAEREGVGARVRVLGHCPPGEVVRRAAEHHVGLALEVPATVNRDLCVTNKLFTYLLAGLPAAASATTGQRAVCAALPEATRLYPPGDASALAEAAKRLLADPSAHTAAARAGQERYCWDAEQRNFLAVIAGVVGTAAPARAH